MSIPFSPPYIDDDIRNEVMSVLDSGWITSGPKVKELERLVSELCGVDYTIAVNSWTSGALLVLKWLGLKPGDEVIVPAYTYSATALAVLHWGATPVMVDVEDDFNISVSAIERAITSRTKAIIAVDIGGWPADYSAIVNLLNSPEIMQKFQAETVVQQKLERPLLISDAAHSMGCKIGNASPALLSDITIYSLHAVKNVTTAEGGVVCLNLPGAFDLEQEREWFKINTLNGQTKDAFTKSMAGGWRYDIISQGMKINMPDICAALGVVQLRKYEQILLPTRKKIFEHYNNFFKKRNWAICPPYLSADRQSSCHLYLLRMKGINEEMRGRMIEIVSAKGISVNVHFIPMPMLTLFRNLGYDIHDYPVAYNNYSCEISLPIYPQLSLDECEYIENAIESAYKEVSGYQAV